MYCKSFQGFRSKVWYIFQVFISVSVSIIFIYSSTENITAVTDSASELCLPASLVSVSASDGNCPWQVIAFWSRSDDSAPVNVVLTDALLQVNVLLATIETKPLAIGAVPFDGCTRQSSALDSEMASMGMLN